MAKTSMIQRELRRKRAHEKHAKKRAELKKTIRSLEVSEEERAIAVVALQKLPRDSSITRKRNRCAISGRPHGYYRKFGLSRNMLRQATMNGEIPGLRKASW